MWNFLKFTAATSLVLIGCILVFLAIYDLLHPETRTWVGSTVMILAGVVISLGGTAIIEISLAKVRRAGRAEAEFLFPQLAARHGVVTPRMLYECTALSTTHSSRLLENLVAEGKAERIPHGREWAYRPVDDPHASSPTPTTPSSLTPNH